QESLQRLRTDGEADWRVSQLRQCFANKPHQRLFVIYDEDAPSTRSMRFGLCTFSFWLARHGDLAREWQVDLLCASPSARRRARSRFRAPAKGPGPFRHRLPWW